MTRENRMLATGLSAGAIALVLASSSSARSAIRLDDSSRAMAEAAVSFLAELDADEKSRATWSFDDPARFDWHFVPREREGLPLKDMSAGQRAAAHRLLGSALSAQGYLKATGAMQLEGILGALEGRPDRRDPEDYYVSIFGAPTTAEPWAWRYEGHHLSLNFTAVPGALPKVTPAFIGSNPHVVPDGPQAGWSLLAGEEDLARELLGLLDEGQRGRAVLAAEAPADILTGNARRVELDRYEGLPASEMSAEQRDVLERLLGAYLHNAAHDIAHEEMERIREAGLGRLHFAWAGGTERGEGHYYRIHGPTVLIEYDNVQGGANHVHSVWRDPENDFGDDLLGRHYEEAEHHLIDREP